MINYKHNAFLNDAIQLLQRLVTIPSISRNEEKATDEMALFMQNHGISFVREGNNIIVADPHHDTARPTILLNAHIDTVKPVATWTLDPFTPTIKDGRIYGLGTNDCGGGLVTLLQVFRIMVDAPRNYNLIYVASAEEEVSGANGFSRVLPLLPKIDLAIVGEPTAMQPAIAEKGLMVIDAESHGKSGHAARNEGVNAIYEALDDLVWLHNYQFEKVSPLLGPTRLSVTMINAGTQHNVVPDKCSFVIDVRTNELYTNQEVFELLCRHLKSTLRARSFRLSSSSIDSCHPIVERCKDMGMTPFGSPTLSDQALMPFTSIKIGPGHSTRSHSADEYICMDELEEALDIYIRLLDGLNI